jgi:YjbE family integral membrane protein
MDFTSSVVWVALGYIIFTNILLSGDNAVVIAMASRNLPAEQQKKAIFWGSAAAIILRVILTLVAIQLLALPYLKIIGAILLIYIGVQLMADSDDEENIDSPPSIFTAIRTILIADLVMSLDNVVAVAAAADRAPEEMRMLLILIGLGLSIPLIIFGSTILLKIMDKYPIIVTLGAALLGFLAGEMFATDPAIHNTLVEALGAENADAPFQIIGIALVVIIGLWLKKKSKHQEKS